MNILFDHSVPAPLAKGLSSHYVRTAAQENWNALKNGDLLATIESSGRFDVFVTCDQNIAFQQDLTDRTLAVIVIDTNIWPVIMTDIDKVVRAVNAATTSSMQIVRYP